VSKLIVWPGAGSVDGREHDRRGGKAVEERLERVRGKSKEGMAEKLLKIARSSGPLWRKPYVSLEELLYDEKGLPKGLK